MKPADRLFNLLALASGAGGLFLVMLFYAEHQAKVLVAFFADIVIGWHVRPPTDGPMIIIFSQNEEIYTTVLPGWICEHFPAAGSLTRLRRDRSGKARRIWSWRLSSD